MASSCSSFSSSNSWAINPQQKHKLEEKYSVFLSFRGEDTRNGFASYLYAALYAKHISTFMDHQLERGAEISPTLSKAIQESKIWVIIFSENYAWSTWCLDELVQILECNKRNQQSVVIPTFYGIEPCAVRKQKGSYGNAFAELEERFQDRNEKVHQWRAALTEASSLCGFDSKDFRPECQLVQKIVEDISLKLHNYLSVENFYGDHLVGIQKKAQEVELLLSIGSPDVRIVGIWGMAGIGKTTLASAVYQRLYTHFEGQCFLWNVREEYERNGPDHLRKKLLSVLLNDEDIPRTDSPFVASLFVLQRLRRKKVLIVLDDVDSSRRLEALVQGYDQLAPGSRMIVTARNMQVLKEVADRFYKVEELTCSESLALFQLNALGKNSPSSGYGIFSERIKSYGNGNPLAIKVLASILRSKSHKEWEVELKKLKIIPNAEIQEVLRISYEELDEGTKSTFLDIACLFDQSFSRDHVESILEANGLFVKLGITALIDRSLVENDYGNKLRMHHLIQQMGRTIACNEHKEPGYRSRLWDANDICHMLERKTGTAKVEGISLNMCAINRNVKVSCVAFSNMCNLRILKIYVCHNIMYENNICDNMNNFKLHLPQGLDSFPSAKLNYFQWDFFPLKSLPSQFSPSNLVELTLCNSQLRKLWNHEVQALPVLRRINLSYSKFLTELPDLSVAPNLESINLEGCISLVQGLSSLQNLHKLNYLNLSLCTRLRDLNELSRQIWGHFDVLRFRGVENLWSNICQLNFTCLKSSVQWLTSNLSITSTRTCISQNFPMNLTHLVLSGTEIEAVTPSIACLSGLVDLDLSWCYRLQSLPSSICKLKSLESLRFCGCGKLDKIPEILEPMEHLISLELNGTGIKVLPESIENLVSLTILNLSGCKDFEFLPNSLCCLRQLEKMDLMHCSKLKNLPPLPHALLQLLLDGCESLKSIAELPSLGMHLSARGCASLENISNWRASLPVEKYSNAYLEGEIFDFDGCGKLDQNTCNSLLTDRAVFQILYYLKFMETVFPEFLYSHRFPIHNTGGIPKWFKHQACGMNSINVALPTYWNNDDFLGFAFCLHFQNVTTTNHLRPLGIRCKLIFKTDGDDDHLYEYHGFGTLAMENDYSKTVSMYCVQKLIMQCYRKMDGLNWPCTCSTEVSFHVSLVYQKYGNWKDVNTFRKEHYDEIGKIGIWFIYKEDIERFNAAPKSKNKRCFNEYCGAGGSEVVVSHEDENFEEFFPTIKSKKLKDT